MVSATPQRKFDGVRPEDVVFGDTLGEGKSRLTTHFLILTLNFFSYRCLRPG